jgi:hypothetical protein
MVSATDRNFYHRYFWLRLCFLYSRMSLNITDILIRGFLSLCEQHRMYLDKPRQHRLFTLCCLLMQSRNMLLSQHCSTLNRFTLSRSTLKITIKVQHRNNITSNIAVCHQCQVFCAIYNCMCHVFICLIV